MQIIKPILLISCFLLVGRIRWIDADGLQLYKAGDCVQILIEGAVQISSNIIPLIKESAKCVKYEPQKVKDLDSIYLALMAYRFIQNLINNKNCMDDAINKANSWFQPHLTKFSNRNCRISI